ncbi:bifunctional [glutamine synthetase] adenylyltransferase/[glutamine synthetase]-adenylyl-L-tyrosine phosphorylase [Pseudooceanicola sp.]|uniref:bifunctional [glutamine synthetase] adenylyltransferase/[glutamine synthetase]-adenylyl-L-tyrosine phosphorylase n=1 Tax=Pseudooceanicola sp. TaxID=1914328 RepID=UPI00261E6704|nr:bifunctional [glutamine synthetase] adenylyltransferase/[glutamine synthetase]-adenylyl-L-tyrosine phosphorylase [Pseudooceanicola sp.]MDF1854918.1 bifunctional [glutamine synthetase] adenylyltransferase/[glutamine synthetase]-adenylyl-L-tyrosine phosphorylase [Pseudooceanicola sp.]
MTFASRMTRCPRPHDRDRGDEAAAALPGLDQAVTDLLRGAGGCSPFLSGLIVRESNWLSEVLDAPEAGFDALMADLDEGAADQLATRLRQAKRRVALLIALADLGGVWPLEQVTGRLSDFADRATDLAMKAALAHEIRRGKLPGMGEDDLATGAGMVAFAMGKMGAGELNYSSDIDLIVLFDETRFDPEVFAEARQALIRATRNMAATLSDITGEGYVFRTDLRLRPDPAVTPVCLGMEAAERYYESLGRTWERAAWIKARACAGDLQAGARFINDLRPFVWRRHLDFAAIQDAHDMRMKIRDHKGLHGAIDLPGFDMKQGTGGIRAIEFFAQFHQIVAGGRDPDLRLRGTVPALAALAEKNWIPENLATFLSHSYRAHREVEHRVQMINDAQTHALPQNDEGFARLAAFMDRDVGELRAEISARLAEVHAQTEGFFDRDKALRRSSAPAALPEVDFDKALIARWHGYPALRSTRAQRIFERLKPEILTRLARAARPEEALVAFDGFLAGLPAGVQLFSLFDANPQLIDLLGDIVGTAPELALYLSRNAGVFDAVIGGGFFADWPGVTALSEELTAVLAEEADYERKLDTARRWQKDWHFRIGVHHLRGLSDARAAGAEYAELAEAVLRGVFPVVTAHFAEKHGSPPGRGAVVLGMGSLGAGRLNARSDLDLIVIYDAGAVEQSSGRRPLPARSYYARLTQALVTALSAQMAQGRLYEVDMRLRPSGNQGPVATSWPAFRAYQSEEAWVWEHLALTRARIVAAVGTAGADLGTEVTALRDTLQARRRDRDEVLTAVAEMRARIMRTGRSPDAWEVKTGPGRNQEIELIAQAGALIGGVPSGPMVTGLDGAVRDGWLTPEGREALVAAYDLCWQLGQVAKLLSDRPLDPDLIGAGGRDLLLRETGASDITTLEQRYLAVTARAAEVIDAALAGYGEKGGHEQIR